MTIFRIILGIIILLLGLGVTAVGGAVAIHGSYGVATNIFIGIFLAFFGLGGFVWAGIRLLSGETVSNTLGGLVTAQTGHAGIGMHPGDVVPDTRMYDRSRLIRLKYILGKVLLYTVLTIVVLFVGILSVFRYTPLTLDMLLK